MGDVGGADGGRRTLRVGVRVVVVVPDVATFGGCGTDTATRAAAVSWLPIFTSTIGGASVPPVAGPGVTGTAAVNLREPAPKGIISTHRCLEFLCEHPKQRQAPAKARFHAIKKPMACSLAAKFLSMGGDESSRVSRVKFKGKIRERTRHSIYT